MTADLFIGITSWNSQLFLPSCLESIRATTIGLPIQLHVVDNCSNDQSAEIARNFGAAVTVKSCTQRQALNHLIEFSQCTYSLLIHADVVLLNSAWFALCKQKTNSHVVMVSPQDIGCGPLTRPFGLDKPESSFMLFKTDAMKRLRRLIWRNRFKLTWPRYEFDFSGNHLTHNIPKLLHSKSFEWFPMDVYVSNRCEAPFYVPSSQPAIWSDELAYLRYGLGNFYGIDGQITHYHNWYDRVVSAKEKPRSASQRKEFPPEFINGYSDRFLSDYKLNQVDYPRDLRTDRVPQAL